MDAGTMSISDQRGFISDLGGSFTEDAPRPPVPGEEGELVCSDGRQHSSLTFSSKNDGTKSEMSVATPRRPDLDLGYEPEGSASPTPPYLKWAESLHSLLDDQDGIHLFRKFLKQEGCADMLDFWFACSGFRKLEASEGNEEKKVKLAKAIYKKYIQDNNGIVSRQIKLATKSFIRDCLMRLHIDPAMFDQAQTEIQTRIEENTYPLFLKSDIYLEYTRSGGESPKLCSDQSSVSGNEKGLSGYLPTLNEYEEWRCDKGPEETECDLTPSSLLTQKLLMETVPQRVASSAKFQDSQEYRHGPCREPIDPYYVNAGHVLAPATSANDSEQQSMSSDAETLSLTDSSVDGVPPYRYRKQHRREMHESAKANGRVPLPHFPRTNRIPKDINVEPERFAAELIRRLEGVLREREAEEKLEERLKRVRLEEEGDEVSSPSSLPSQRFPPSAYSMNYNPRYAEITYSSPFVQDAHEENPESILDDHVQRVMKTPISESPGTGRHSPKSRSPDGLSGVRGVAHSGQGKHSARHGLKGETSHPYNHKYVPHSHASIVEPEGAPRSHGSSAWSLETSYYGSKSRSYADGMVSNPVEHSSKSGPQCKRAFKRGEETRAYDVSQPAEEAEKKQKILLWLMDGQKEMAQHKISPYGSVSGSKRTVSHEGSCLSSSERYGLVHPCLSGQGRSNVQPFHPFIQDPTMPPNPAPSPLIQLEEVCRRLEEEKIKSGALQPKQRYVMEVIQRGRAAVRPPPVPLLNMVPAVSDSELSEPEHKATKKQPCGNITVAYYFCEELIPYMTSVKGRVVTLGQFKELLTKKGNYRYYFKKVSDDFDCGVVFEEVREDDAVLPIFEEKIIGKVERVD
ncbi:axin-1-like [Girardinichthys multiradiatus]|uniref:axin-1-like n=1 Tax=Girardinichthys multiradiatus TaxID=208333 RepID=UPI001FAD36EB|nr:axin-1-like [Girardinichthys multiradiatus]XP_047213137.1 axin-1-like [Girardinichthys multiradiatus]XP_047213138.1 axin-1-like [Girardinichthys multiradiatus]XP_047213139.1 axin-1-like [Girardinichthys multiradiatus]